MEIEIPLGKIFNNGEMFVNERVKVSAEEHHGFAVFLDPVVNKWSITHIESGGNVAYCENYSDVDNMCKDLAEIKAGTVPLSKLNPCDLVECIPLFRSRVLSVMRKYDVAVKFRSSDAHVNVMKSWSEYLHCRTEKKIA